MTNEEKARELAEKHEILYENLKRETLSDYPALLDTALAMAQWKDEEMKELWRLANNMFETAHNLSTDASSLRKAMDEFKKFRDDYNYEHSHWKSDSTTDTEHE